MLRLVMRQKTTARLEYLSLTAGSAYFTSYMALINLKRYCLLKANVGIVSLKTGELT